jgi:hypothetical protein
MSNKITIEYLENEIKNLNTIENWDEKITEIKIIKEKIDEENNNINNILATLDEPYIITKEYNINKIVDSFNKCDISKKIKYYQFLNQHIKNIESELFN